MKGRGLKKGKANINRDENVTNTVSGENSLGIHKEGGEKGPEDHHKMTIKSFLLGGFVCGVEKDGHQLSPVQVCRDLIESKKGPSTWECRPAARLIVSANSDRSLVPGIAMGVNVTVASIKAIWRTGAMGSKSPATPEAKTHRGCKKMNGLPFLETPSKKNLKPAQKALHEQRNYGISKGGRKEG